MKLAEFTANLKREIYDDLIAGRAPRTGEYSEALLKEGRAKGRPQMGSATFSPTHITVEFITQDPQGSAIILSVRVAAPERIVYMPVPDWVVQSVWQGEVLGSYQFESHAKRLVAAFENSLEPGANAELFGGEAPPTGRA